MNAQKMIVGAAVVAVLALAVWVWRRGAAGVAQDLTRGTVNAAAGVVVGAGQAVGLPATDAQKCAAAKAAGNKLDASLYCPAGDFIPWLFSGSPATLNEFANVSVLRKVTIPESGSSVGTSGEW